MANSKKKKTTKTKAKAKPTRAKAKPTRSTRKPKAQVAVELVFSGRKDEELPDAAVFRLSASGKPVERLAGLSRNKLAIDRAWAEAGDLIAVGPDLPLEELREEQLLKARLSRSFSKFEQEPRLVIPDGTWRLWPVFQICLHGTARACHWWFPLPHPLPLPELIPRTLPKLEAARAVTEPRVAKLQPARTELAASALPMPWPPLPPYHCHPICDGVVEVYERRCCCPIWIILDELLERLPEIVDDPIPGPGPDPGPLRSTLKHRLGRGLADPAPVAPRLAEDYRALKSMPREQAVEYVEARPYLWPIACTCSLRKLGETALRVGGDFDFCFKAFPEPLIYPYKRCRRTYAYKVKQHHESGWVYIYDGLARNEYFTASEHAELRSWDRRARACHDPGPDIDHDGDFVALDKIGGTSSHLLVSPVQSAVDGLNQALSANCGLSFPPGESGPNNRPWAKTLHLRLKISAGLEAKGAEFYRISVARADASGNPTGDWRFLNDAVSWQYYEYDPTLDKTFIKAESLGPKTAGSAPDVVEALYTIPYDNDREWRGVQFHHRWDTTEETGELGAISDRFLIRVEIFDAAGNRLKPNGATGAGTATGFDFLRLSSETEGTNVDYAALVHGFWADNRPCVGDIKDLRFGGVQEDDCLFLTGKGSDGVAVGFCAGHYGGPPGETFMKNYSLTWKKGLHGPSGSFETGTQNHPDPFADVSTASASKTIDQLLGPTDKKCTFAVNLHVYPKHFDGNTLIRDYEAHDVASFALEKKGN